MAACGALARPLPAELLWRAPLAGSWPHHHHHHHHHHYHYYYCCMHWMQIMHMG
jgi:hypothetical protein